MATPGTVGVIKQTSSLAVLKKNTAAAQLNNNSITPGWTINKPSSNGVAPPTTWLKSK